MHDNIIPRLSNNKRQRDHGRAVILAKAGFKDSIIIVIIINNSLL